MDRRRPYAVLTGTAGPVCVSAVKNAASGSGSAKTAVIERRRRPPRRANGGVPPASHQGRNSMRPKSVKR